MLRKASYSRGGHRPDWYISARGRFIFRNPQEDGMAAKGKQRNLGIADVIEGVRNELIESDLRRQASNRDALFITKQFELELNFTVQREGGADGKVSFNVLGVGGSLGGSGKVSSGEVQKLKLTFDAVGVPLKAADLNTVDLSKLPLGTRHEVE
jgi:Trypsin-co-occurring domain 2